MEGVEPETKRKWGPPGLVDALDEALKPFVHLTKGQSLEDLVESIQNTIMKSGKKTIQGEAAGQRGSSCEADVVLAEYVGAVMESLSRAHYDKEWLGDVDWSKALVAQIKYSFKSSKVIVRTLGCNLKKFVDDAIFRIKEDERIEKVMTEGLSLSGLSEDSVKRARKHLDYAYNEAQMAAPYGETAANTPEMGLVQDLVKFWMTEFAGRAWDIIEGIEGGTHEDRCTFLTNVFTYMCDPLRSILPQDLLAQLDAPPPENWPFIHEQAQASLKELDENPAKRQKWGAGFKHARGGGGGW